MDVYFVRHAESVNNVLLPKMGGDREAFEFERHPDAPLTDRGVEQVERVARRMAAESPQASVVLCSYLHRALRTAKALREAVVAANGGAAEAAEVRVYRDIHEIGGHYGRSRETNEYFGTPGRTGAETLAEFPDFRLMEPEKVADGWWREAPGKETTEAALARGRSLFTAIADLYAEERPAAEVARAPRRCVFIVTHGLFFRTVVQDWIQRGLVSGPPLEGHDTLTVDPLRNTAVTALRYVPGEGEGRLEVVYQNCVEHVADIGFVPHTYA